MAETPAKLFGLAPGLDEDSVRVLETGLRDRGWRRVHGPGWNLLFYGGIDPPTSVYGELTACQAINHFPGAGDAFDKVALFRNLRRMQRACTPGSFPLEGDVMPETFELPGELEVFRSRAAETPGAFWIRKPRFGTRGREISLVSRADTITASDKWMVQRYLDRPMLYRGCKFNLRVFALITSVDPPELFIYSEGYLDRAARAWDPSNHRDMVIHNTNSEFQASRRVGPGEDLSIPLSEWLGELSDSGLDPGVMWERIRTLALMTLLSCLHVVVPIARRSLPHPRNCFELLGLDILVDEDGRPWLIECNRSPSLTTTFIPRIKYRLVDDLLGLLETNLFGEPSKPVTDRGFERLEAEASTVSLFIPFQDT